MVLNERPKPRILLLVDRPDWAFHTLARAVSRHLSYAYDFEIMIGSQLTHIDDARYDLIHVFYEFETHHLPFLRGSARVLKSVYSHYWQERGMSVSDFYEAHLREAHAVSVPSEKLLFALRDLPVPVHLCPEGLDTDLFSPPNLPRSGPFVVGWAGASDRPIKRFEWLKEACDGICELRVADGRRSQEDMVEFYRGVDVIACSSKAEGSPRPLIEGMSCGAFPVSFDAGIAPEVIRHGQNGLIVREESIEGLRSALVWCKDHIDDVRRAGATNVEIARARRDWRTTLPAQQRAYELLLRQR